MGKFGFGAEISRGKFARVWLCFAIFLPNFRGGLYRQQELLNCTTKPLNNNQILQGRA